MAWVVKKHSGKDKSVLTYYIYFRIAGITQKPFHTTDYQTHKNLLDDARKRESLALAGIAPTRKIAYQLAKDEYLKQSLKHHTATTHKRVITFFNAFDRLLTLRSTADFTVANLQLWEDARSKEVVEATVNREITIAQAISTFWREQGYIENNVARGLKRYSETRTDKKDFLFLEDVSRAIALVTPGSNLEAAFKTAWHGGMRREEICMTDIWKDIDTRNHKIHVHAKPDMGWKIKSYEERTIPHDPAYSAYIEARRKMFPHNRWLVTGKSGGRLDPASLTHTAERFFRKTGIVTAIMRELPGLHSFRHSFGTYLLHNNAPLRDVQRLLGHASIRTTEIYLHTAERYLQQAASKLPPLPQLLDLASTVLPHKKRTPRK